MDHQELTNQRVHAIARAHGCTINEVHAALDRHPVELNRDRFLKRTLAFPPEGLCEINRSQEAKVLATCRPGRFCRVYGVVEDCKDNGECSEITRVLSARRR